MPFCAGAMVKRGARSSGHRFARGAIQKEKRLQREQRAAARPPRSAPGNLLSCLPCHCSN